MRTRGLWVLAAMIAATVALAGVAVARSMDQGHPDLPSTHPASIFPTNWNGAFNDGAWHAGGNWRLRDSATNSSQDLSFQFHLRWAFPNQEFIVVAKCDRGKIHINDGAGETTVPCGGTFGEAAGGAMPRVFVVTVDRSQRLDWGIGVYSQPV